MKFQWPEPGTKAQSALHAILLILGEGGLFAWAVIPAVADWYASVGSAAPNAATGQTSLIKGIYAVGYGTPQQAEWFTNLLTAAFGLILFAGWAAKSSDYERVRKAKGRRLTPNAVFWVIWITLLLGGGHWISLIETGAWAFPDHHSI